MLLENALRKPRVSFAISGHIFLLAPRDQCKTISQTSRSNLERERPISVTRSKRELQCLVVPALFLLLAMHLVAQDTPVAPEGTQVATQETPAAAANSDALRKAAQNPVASLISVPIQDNFNTAIEPGYRTQNVLNIQPVIPLKASENWNLIIRWITPIIYQPLPASPGAPEGGFPAWGTCSPLSCSLRANHTK
jgi:hypothetical protein